MKNLVFLRDFSSSEVRPCERRKFPYFLFSRVSEMFGFRSSEIFWKYPVFSNSQKFCEKVQKKVRKLKFGNNFKYYSNFKSNSKISKKLCKIWGFRSKNPVFGSKSSEKLGKTFGKVWKKFGNLETGFSECSEISEIWKFRTFRKLRKNEI